VKTLVKNGFHNVCLVLAFPMAALAGFGRFETAYQLFSQFCAMFPGLPGDYIRTAFYRMTLEECSKEIRIQFGSFFAHPRARVGRLVYVGSYCVLGQAVIGDRTQIASGVQILSGRHQHSRDVDGRILGAEQGVFQSVTIGSDCWIGAAAIIMADVGAGCTIGAGAVVTKPIPPNSVAAGSPARVLRSTVIHGNE
jgi:virginiamycin A acetyltransferase